MFNPGGALLFYTKHLLAKLAPELSNLNELERTLRTRFGAIGDIAVLPVNDLRT
jgi:hypothetical protein